MNKLFNSKLKFFLYIVSVHYFLIIKINLIGILPTIKREYLAFHVAINNEKLRYFSI
jgi:hypothetical protein